MRASDKRSVRQQRVADELRRLREESRLSGEAVAAKLGWSPSKISRVERLRTGIDLYDLEKLLGVYRARRVVPEARLAALQAFAEQASEPGAAMAAMGSRAAEDRDEAAQIQEWAPVAVPLLLQTPDYASAALVSRMTSTQMLPGTIKRVVRELRTRQERVSDGELEFQAVIDETVLVRRCGSAAVMHDQLEHLLKVAELPNVDLRALPFGTEGPIGIAPFRYLTFDPIAGLELPDAVLLDRLTGTDRFGAEGETFPYQLAFRDLWRAAADAEASVKLIEAALRGSDRSRARRSAGHG